MVGGKYSMEGMENTGAKGAKSKRAPRSKKAVPVADSIVSVFGGKVEEKVAPSPAIFIEEIEHEQLPSPKKPLKKSGKKQAVIAQVTPDGIQGSLTPVSEQRPLIAHLPIHASDIDNDMFAPTQNSVSESVGQPNPYDSTTESYAIYGQEQSKPIQEEKHDKVDHVSRPSLPLHYSERLMVRFQDANREQRLPESTDVACYWDCHPFRGTPCVIPTVIEEGIWRVYGNFCCPECAAAYLFHERLDLHVQWERYALLNRLYAPESEPVRLAPARTVLRLFGGTLDISDFRSNLSERRLRVDVMTPPMISIIQVMDTKPIDFYDASMKNTFIPWEMDRMNRPGAQGLRLRRSKPVAEKEATLEYCMGIVA
jgi:hypothetical protein